MTNFKVVACSPPGCSCPTLTIEENLEGRDMVIITDDYNGVVMMTPKEFNMLCQGFSKEFNKIENVLKFGYF